MLRRLILNLFSDQHPTGEGALNLTVNTNIPSEPFCCCTSITTCPTLSTTTTATPTTTIASGTEAGFEPRRENITVVKTTEEAVGDVKESEIRTAIRTGNIVRTY